MEIAHVGAVGPEPRVKLQLVVVESVGQDGSNLLGWRAGSDVLPVPSSARSTATSLER